MSSADPSTHSETVQPYLPQNLPDTYRLEIAGLVRHLPVVRISDSLAIAGFDMLGDVELVDACAQALAQRLATLEFDYLLGPEAKVLPLLHTVSTYMQRPQYVVARKSIKGYMKNPLSIKVQSITTTSDQSLVLDGPDARRLQRKKVVIVDDVVSTGGTIAALKALLDQVQAEIVAVATALREGDDYSDPLIYLAQLPVFPLITDENGDATL